MSESKIALIVFVRNPELGKVKTRLAKNIGDEKALAIYEFLLQHTKEIISKTNTYKYIYYVDIITQNDIWDLPNLFKKVQKGTDLGERLCHAFEELTLLGYKKIMVIGSDCYQLKAQHIEQAISYLENYKVVVGPTFDGGYYLLATNGFYPELFKNKSWSTKYLMDETIADCEQLNLSYQLLEKLNDIDEVEDLHQSGLTHLTQ